LRAPPSWAAGKQAAALDRRLSVVGRDLIGRVVVVAARVRPADIVEQQQRRLRARLLRPVAEDRPDLL
jgi:hypothetical protein